MKTTLHATVHDMKNINSWIQKKNSCCENEWPRWQHV